jgi:NAD(P)H-dependent flavin oxidoreductase YrpB (nitropropane dioxygenase family)
MLGIGRQSVAVVSAYLDELGSLTRSIVGCTFIEPFVRDDVVALVADRLPVIEFFFGWPSARRLPADRICGWQVGTVDEARAAVDAGCRYVIAQAREAGGHVRGVEPFDSFVTSVLAAVDVPVVAAGGIGTRADVSRALALGADAVRVGTRFVATTESNAHPAYIDALATARADDTVLTEAFGVGWPDAPHRVLQSSIAAASAASVDVVGEMALRDGRVVPMPRFGASVPTRETTGDIAAMALYAGTSVDDVHRTMSAADVVRELCGE